MKQQGMAIVGVDFTSAPSARKPIVVARAWLEREVSQATCADSTDPWILTIKSIDRYHDWGSYESFLATPAKNDDQFSQSAWLMGGFDFPFGLPKALLKAWQWDRLDYRQIAERFSEHDRHYWVNRLKAFCDARAVGDKFAHRACDYPAGSSPSMKWVNPPVVFMYREGFKRLIKAQWLLPGFESLETSAASTAAPIAAQHEVFASPLVAEQTEGCTSPLALALEAYPGHLARLAIGRASYKSDSHTQDPARRAMRETMLERLAAALPLRFCMPPSQRDAMIDDGRGDSIDAWLCAIQAAWAATKGPPRWGAAPDADPTEGWIASLDLARFFAG
ncbi:MAG: DUF429 domain-containing protein [Betaproteobacteria bacterium]|nr:DUF429 domain-containing protein [Betaproteobacteria bacterium]